MNRRSLVVISVVAAALLLGAIYLTLPKQNNREDSNTSSTPSDIKVDDNTLVNDAGINIDYDYSKPSGVEYTILKTYSTTLFGMPQLVDELYKNRNQINNIHHDISSALLNYGDIYLKKQYDKLTILPSETKIEKDTITGTIKLGETDSKIPFSVTIIGGKRAYVVVDDSKFIYIGGLQDIHSKNGFSIKQSNFTSTNLIISGKDKERALKYITAVGYKVPDFKITFTGYKSPFDEK